MIKIKYFVLLPLFLFGHLGLAERSEANLIGDHSAAMFRLGVSGVGNGLVSRSVSCEFKMKKFLTQLLEKDFPVGQAVNETHEVIVIPLDGGGTRLEMTSEYQMGESPSVQVVYRIQAMMNQNEDPMKEFPCFITGLSLESIK